MPKIRTSTAVRWLKLLAALPLLQAAGCLGDFAASAIATETTTRVSEVLFFSLETVLLNAFGV